MYNMSKRLDKVEKKMQLIETEANERKAKLLEIQKLGKDDSLEALILELELQYGHELSLIDLMALTDIPQTNDS